MDNGTAGSTGVEAWPHLDFSSGGFALMDRVVQNNLVHTYFNVSNSLIGVGYTQAGFAATQGTYSTSLAPGNGISLTDRVLYFAPIHLDRGVHDTLYFGTQHLYRSLAFFTSPTFSKVNTADLAPAVPPSAFGGEISAIETVANPAAGMNAQVLFTGADNGRVFRSTDGGVMFDEVDTGALGHYVSDILAVPGDPSIVYQSRSAFTGATPPHTVRKSVDGGLTWSDASTGLPDVPANALALDPIVPNRIWLGTDVGMYVSTDAAQSWQPYNDGLPNVPVFDLASSNAGAVILACTYGRGAFVLHLDQIFGDGFGS